MTSPSGSRLPYHRRPRSCSSVRSLHLAPCACHMQEGSQGPGSTLEASLKQQQPAAVHFQVAAGLEGHDADAMHFDGHRTEAERCCLRVSRAWFAPALPAAYFIHLFFRLPSTSLLPSSFSSSSHFLSLLTLPLLSSTNLPIDHPSPN
jgi:hypothetical protein